VIGSYPLEIMADGTKFKGEGVNGKARQGDIKAVIGITRQGKVFPMGTWTGTSWNEVNREWKGKNIKLPDGSIIVCDGEPGLADSFADYVDKQQRCPKGGGYYSQAFCQCKRMGKRVDGANECHWRRSDFCWQLQVFIIKFRTLTRIGSKEHI